MAKRVCLGIALVIALAGVHWSTVGCGFAGVKGCPPQTAKVGTDCKAEVDAGRMTREKCESLIEESCP